MAEIKYQVDVSQMFTREQYEKLIEKIKRHGKHHLFFQGESIVAVRDTAMSSRSTKLWIANYTRMGLPPYLMLLKDIEYAIETYGREPHDPAK